ncbi:hypothetical protein G7046_g2853 [Stylonectria norvegica]|nr:hypothetical protein G7046_g2853 [Stylonectria norvegica]
MPGTHADPAFMAKLARRTHMNENSMVAFAGAIAGLAGIFILFHLFRAGGRRYGYNRKVETKPSFLVGISREARGVFLRKVPTLPSAGHMVIILLYLAINVIVTFTNNDNNNFNLHANIAARTGWMAIGNLLIVVFLALKNTPLAFLTAWSYERLNVLHRVSGYTTICFVIVHASSYSSYFATQHRLSRLTEIDEVYGMVAGVSFLILGIAGGLIRRWWYELFYYIHVAFWMLAIIMTGLHQPELSKKIIYVTCVAAGIWVLDRLVRLARLIINSANNSVSLTPLPNGGTRVTLTKPPIRASAGQHCFLWVPRIRCAEMHPFTIAAADPVEFVVASHDGFTRALHQHAQDHPGEPLKASVEGAYGAFPDPMTHDKVVLVAGGSGASFAFGVALDMLKKMGSEDKKSIQFVWMIRHQSYSSWFGEHLKTLQSDSHISVQVYVTRRESSAMATAKTSSTPETSSRSLSIISDPEKIEMHKLTIPPNSGSVDLEKMSPTSLDDSPSSPTSSINPFPTAIVAYKRPDVPQLIRTAVEKTSKDERVLIMGCGPESLMTAVRNTTVDCIRRDGPSVELHCEQFGW